MRVEALDAELHDLRPTLYAELALGLHFRRKTVAVPAEAPLYAFSAQRLIAGKDVLDVAGDEVSVVGQAVREGWAVVEDVLVRAALTGWALRHRTLERAVALPDRQHAALDLGKARLRIDVGIVVALAALVALVAALTSGGHVCSGAPARVCAGSLPAVGVRVAAKRRYSLGRAASADRCVLVRARSGSPRRAHRASARFGSSDCRRCPCRAALRVPPRARPGSRRACGTHSRRIA